MSYQIVEQLHKKAVTVGQPERVNDFAALGVMNLLWRLLVLWGWRTPMVVG